MKRFAIFTVFMLIATSLLFSFPARAMVDGGGGGPEPGDFKLYYPLSDDDKNHTWIRFEDNDAYESGLVDNVYEFFASIWGNYNNQRVTLVLHINYGDKSTGDVDTNKPVKATLYQQKSWVGDSLWKDEKNDTHNLTVEVYWTKIDHYIGSQNYPDYEAHIGILSSSSDFYPGLFKVEVVAFAKNDTTHLQEWRKVAEIYGCFTQGNADVKDVHDATYWKPGEQPYTSATISFGEGQWHVKLWYGDRYPPIDVSRGQVNISKHPNAHVVKDFGEFKRTTVTLRYNFTDNDPPGVYVWILTASYGGSLLNSYIWTVYNNQDSLKNGTDHPPYAEVERLGTFVQGMEVTFLIHVHDDNSSKIHVWVVAWWGNNKYAMPEPDTPLVFFYFHDMGKIPNGESRALDVTLNYYGNVNLNIFTLDESGNLNITRVQYYVAKASGGGYDMFPSWFMWPWEDTTHLILFVLGLLFVLAPRNIILRIIGLVMIAVSFIDFGYVGLMISQYFKNPLQWRCWR